MVVIQLPNDTRSEFEVYVLVFINFFIFSHSKNNEQVRQFSIIPIALNC